MRFRWRLRDDAPATHLALESRRESGDNNRRCLSCPTPAWPVSVMFDPSAVKSRVVYGADRLYSLAADHAAGRLYAGSMNYDINVYDLAVEKKEPVGTWKAHDNYVTALGLLKLSAGPQVVSGSYDRRLIWWNPADGQAVRVIEGHAGWIRDLTVLPDGVRLASVADDMLVKLWDGQTGELIRVFEGHATRTPQGHVTALYAVAVSPDGRFVASGDRQGVVRVCEVDTGALAATFEVPVLYTYDPRQRKRSIGGIRSLCFSPDGNRLAAGGIGQIDNVDGLAGPLTVELWDWQAPRRLATLGADGHQAMVNALLFHPNEPWLLGAGGGSGNAALLFWKLDELPPPPEPPSPGDTADGTPESANQAETKPPAPVNGHKITFDGHPHRMLLRPDNAELYVAGQGRLEIWSLMG
jgi:WD40 repeat protein